jgi:hypothetical protein
MDHALEQRTNAKAVLTSVLNLECVLEAHTSVIYLQALIQLNAETLELL